MKALVNEKAHLNFVILFTNLILTQKILNNLEP